MNILILTPISSVYAAELYNFLSKKLDYNKDVGFLCFPFFAETKSMLTDTAYVPNLFAMIRSFQDEDMKKNLMNKKINIVIGNTYNDTKYDMIVSFKAHENEVFDSYLELINTDEEFKEFREKVETDKLYKLEDAEIDLPTFDHVKLFLEGVLESGNKTKQKTIKRN